ncbi:MAG: hypothetical protein KY476_23390, partial [Planctomycetes bacterium]|nr:hypothetical protein [Planctomycetota bacterium]
SDEEALNAIIAIRVGRGDVRNVKTFGEAQLPDMAEALDAMDQLVIAGDGLGGDPAALSAVRRWILGGGRAWILLDRVSPHVVERLLGESFACGNVDRVGLTDIAFEPADRDAAAFGTPPRQFEQPVDLVRVIPQNVRVRYRMNGWPAAFEQPFGRGRLLFTTLGPRAWYRPRTPADPHNTDPRRTSSQVALGPLEFLAAEFLSPKVSPAADPSVFAPYLAERIGYEVVDRRVVIAVLAGFCVVLGAAGLWLRGRGRSELMRWLGPAAAVAAALVLVAAGYAGRQAAPDTAAVGQFVHVLPGSSDFVLSGLAALYHREGSSGTIGSDGGGVAFPDLQGLEGGTGRMLWTDYGRWRWQNLTLPPGVRTATMYDAGSLPSPVEFRATFGPSGLEGRISAEGLDDLSEAIVVTPHHGAVAVHIDESGRFTARPADLLAPGQYVASTLLSDEQRRRQTVYQRLLSAAGNGRADEDDESSGRTRTTAPVAGGVVRDRPLLLAFARPLDAGLEFPDATRRVGAALVLVPAEIDRTPAGTSVAVPAPFVTYRAGPRPGEISYSPAYDNGRHRWNEFTGPKETWLRFQVPPEVLPLKLERARIIIKISGPSRRLELVGLAGRRARSLAVRSEPLGTLSFDIDRPEVLALDEGGGFSLGVFVGDETMRPDDADLREGVVRNWQIESLRASIHGTTLPRPTTESEH